MASTRIPLNIHLWIDIFELLDVESLLACRLTCRQFKSGVELVRKKEILVSFADFNEIRNDTWFWLAPNQIADSNKIFVSAYDLDKVRSFLAFLAKPIFWQVRRLKLVFEYLYRPNDFRNGAFNRFLNSLENFKDLEHLELTVGECDSHENLQHVTINHPTLRILHFDFNSFTNDEYLFDLPALTHLQYFGFPDPIQIRQSFTEPTRNNISFFSSNNFVPFDVLPGVVNLDLICPENLGQEFIESILSCPNLRCLFLKECFGNSNGILFDNKLKELLQRNRNLQIFLDDSKLLVTEEMLNEGNVLGFLDLINNNMMML